MTAPQSFERRLERWVHYSLLSGLALSALLLAGGLARAWMASSAPAQARQASVRRTLEQAVQGDPAAITMLGVLVLMATPLVRVVVLAAGWAIDREWRFAGVALVVLALLALSMALGLG